MFIGIIITSLNLVHSFCTLWLCGYSDFNPDLTQANTTTLYYEVCSVQCCLTAWRDRRYSSSTLDYRDYARMARGTLGSFVCSMPVHSSTQTRSHIHLSETLMAWTSTVYEGPREAETVVVSSQVRFIAVVSSLWTDLYLGIAASLQNSAETLQLQSASPSPCFNSGLTLILIYSTDLETMWQITRLRSEDSRYVLLIYLPTILLTNLGDPAHTCPGAQ